LLSISALDAGRKEIAEEEIKLVEKGGGGGRSNISAPSLPPCFPADITLYVQRRRTGNLFILLGYISFMDANETFIFLWNSCVISLVAMEENP
jgi:hypothetical protein